MSDGQVSRRRFIGVLAAGSAALPVLLEACGGTAAPSSLVPASSGPTSAGASAGAAAKPSVAGSAPAAASGSAAGKASGPYPTYAPAQGGPKPDFPSIGPLYEDGFMNFPKNPVKAWTKDPPGAGGNVQALVVTTRPAVPNALDQNPAWQQINKALNVNFQFNKPSAADYTSKLATIMAGNDLPDVLCFRNGLNGTPNLPQFLDQSMADLTPYLGGDAAKDYPFLAALPTFAWKNTGCVSNGKLFMIPSVNASLGSGFFRNVNIYDAEIGQNYTPKNSDDFKRVLQQLTKPSAGRYGIGTYQGVAFDFAMSSPWAAMFGAPNNWQLDSSGKLIKDRETPQFKEAVGYVRDLYAAGVYHPDSLSLPDNATEGDAFTSGKFVLIIEGYAGTWQQQWFRGLTFKLPNTFMPLGPFPAHDGAKPVYYLNPGASITTGLKKAAPDRIKELLRVLDWLSAPFGSAEDLLLTYGAADVDWKADANGYPAPTDKSNADAAAVNWKNIVAHPAAAFAVGLPEFAKATVDSEHALFPLAAQDPTLGLVSLTNNSKGVTLNKTFTDGLTDVIAGRRPLADYDQLVKDWQSSGGETIRQEFLKAIAAAQA